MKGLKHTGQKEVSWMFFVTFSQNTFHKNPPLCLLNTGPDPYFGSSRRRVCCATAKIT